MLTFVDCLNVLFIIFDNTLTLKNVYAKNVYTMLQHYRRFWGKIIYVRLVQFLTKFETIKENEFGFRKVRV